MFSGHVNTNSLNNYRGPNSKQQCGMSTILSSSDRKAKPQCLMDTEANSALVPINSNLNRSLPPVSCPQPNLSMNSVSNEQHISLPQNSHGNPHGNIFSGADIHGGTFNINVKYSMPQVLNQGTSLKRRRPFIDSDSD